MRLRPAALMLPLLAATLLAQPKPKGTTYVFLVAVSEYENEDQFAALPYTVAETAEFRKVLIDSGVKPDDIKFLRDPAVKSDKAFAPTRAKIEKHLDSLLARLEPDDTLIVVFDGHGIQPTAKVGYFCPSNADLNDFSTLLPLEGEKGIYPKLKAAKCKRKLLLVNACRNDPNFNPDQAATKVNSEYKFQAPEGIAALFSCEPGQRTYYYPPKDKYPRSPEHKRSLFFHHLLEAWQGHYAEKGRPVTLEDIFLQVKRRTAKDADDILTERQNPVMRLDLTRDWVVRVEGQTPASGDSGSAVARKTGKLGDTIDLALTDKVKMKFSWVPPGDSWLGGGGGKEGEEKFTLAEGLWCGTYPVTQGEWEAVMGSNPSKFKNNPRYPVEQVSWDTVQTFIEKANRNNSGGGYLYRLPTEQEWEYICRGGPLEKSQSKYHFYLTKSAADLTPIPTDDLSSKQANFDGNFPAGKGEKGPYLKRPSNVGDYAPNPLGIYDLNGNVCQWTSSKYSADGSPRAVRGGCWINYGEDCRASIRFWNDPADEYDYLGFRVLAVPSGAK